MKIRTKRAALYAWLPVLCLVALSLSTAPGSSEARRAGNLTISPGEFYGGQGVTFKGNIGTAGKRSIWLEFHMGRAGDDWTRIEGSTRETEADGSFEFVFPARGMNNIKLRVAAAGGLATEQKNFTAHDQAVTLAVQPDDLDYGDSYCGGSRRHFISYDAVAAEGYTLTVDSTPDGEPVLEGRGVRLEKRVKGTDWQEVATATIDDKGKATFDLPGSASTGQVAYRARLAEWTDNDSEIGWYPSFPTYVDAQERPNAVTIVEAKDPTADPWADPESLIVEWPTVTDALVDDIIIAWNQGPTPPDRPGSADDRAFRAPSATQLALNDLQPNKNYSFAVFTRSDQGICSKAESDTEKTDPIPQPLPVEGFSATALAPREVKLTWNPISDAPPEGQQLTSLLIYRDGAFVTALPPTETSYTDTTVWPEGNFTYEIYTVNHWDVESPHETAFVQTPPEVTP
ncbi:hypothetical protein HNR19_002327 [Nocardioides thalensis]|uniref:Fibronectin type-III domain-containing protein n=1 Tax=Nocardioides thalensis TaxID=1914755 RepID=A0A853C2R4_9ACTN|nr:hypothetical protein [Nocardioides thalensis]NYJ01629.1 hypothetical protein [Nocardioides thalensis]